MVYKWLDSLLKNKGRNHTIWEPREYHSTACIKSTVTPSPCRNIQPNRLHARTFPSLYAAV